MKTGLVIEGGGLRSAFGFGVLQSWCGQGITFPYTAAVNMSALAACYYRSGQADALEAVFGDYFEAHGELSPLAALKGEHALDAPAFVEEALSAHPLAMEAFAGANTRLEVATTRSDNGDGIFWRLDRVSEAKHLRQFLRAGTTFPGMGEAVQLVERSYFDGSMAEPLPVSHALAEGCDRLVVILTHMTTYTMPHPHLSPKLALALSDVPMTRNVYLLSHLHYNRELSKLHALEAEGRALVIAPVVESTSLHRYGVSRSAAAEFYGEGLRLGQAACARVQRFLEEGQ
ncbi:MAG: patatin-like phospholipase family protein [Peptococcaceae bacterium]|nr:patatin-like phospholipase family protein [Peptococcaceae bacterium]